MTASSIDLPAIELRGVTKVFKDFWLRKRVTAVDDLTLRVEHGEVLGLLGPNGSGKSTTIKMLLGLLYPTRGEIAVLGQHPGSVPLKKNIGYLPEESNLYRFLNARETLGFYADLFGLSRIDREQRIDTLIDMVGLTAQQFRPVGEYSKGMQRRIGIAQALINDPQLLILDEPTSGLDPLGTRQVKDLIQVLKARGKTILLCSHLLNEIEDVCDRIAILYGGKMQTLGRTPELLSITDRQRIECPTLPSETRERLRRWLIDAGVDGEVSIDTPKLDLETLFHRIIREAQSSGIQTSGVQSGGVVAPFLLQGLEGHALLTSLSAPAAPLQVTAPQRVGEQPTIDSSVLAALATPRQQAAEEALDPQAAAAPKDQELLDSLTRRVQ